MPEGFTLWQSLALSSIFFLLNIQPSNARHHHHKLHGQQCRTAMSTLPAHFTYLKTPQSTATTNSTASAPDPTSNEVDSTALVASITPGTSTAPVASTAPATDPTKTRINITGIPWQYEGEPIKSSGDQAHQEFFVTLPANQTTVPGASPSGNLSGTLCIDSGVLYSCSKCDRTLSEWAFPAKAWQDADCYKQVGFERLESTSSGTIACTKWYSRTGYAEGGGVTSQ
ncbi:hypothetical protein VP01_4535g2 [Puccinia sorghi]|uniref:Uncharacterized protein n=1 Tax=Puccinia sorghi TaxID=27349 RepID=A0A0L6UNW7_9BASI|nr:hypothetical protein VP01_4535g2 [Puccinia sorghi]